MPFKSKAQWRACFAADDPNWDCSEMAHSTPSYKELPKKKKKSKKEKKADALTEQLSLLNPVNLAGLPISAIVAAATPTRDLREQATANIDDTWSNLLYKGPYNALKRKDNIDLAKRPELTDKILDLPHRGTGGQSGLFPGPEMQAMEARILAERKKGDTQSAESKKESSAAAPGALHLSHSAISTKSASTMLSHFLADSFNQRVNGVTSGIFKENAFGVQAQNTNALVPTPPQNETALAPQTTDPPGPVTDPLNPNVPVAPGIAGTDPLNPTVSAAPGTPGTDPAETANVKAVAQSFVRPKEGVSLAAAPTQTAHAPNSEVAPGLGIGSFAGGNEPPTGFSFQNSQFGAGAGVRKPLLSRLR